jgi:hypothetical protein
MPSGTESSNTFCFTWIINGGRQLYSITSLAQPSNVAGISMPSVSAAPTSLVVPFFHSHCSAHTDSAEWLPAREAAPLRR